MHVDKVYRIYRFIDLAYGYLDNKAIKTVNVYTVELHTVPWNSLVGGHFIKEDILPTKLQSFV